VRGEEEGVGGGAVGEEGFGGVGWGAGEVALLRLQHLRCPTFSSCAVWLGWCWHPLKSGHCLRGVIQQRKRIFWGGRGWFGKGHSQGDKKL